MKKKRPWYKKLFLQLLANLRIVRGDDPDFKENVKIGLKTKVKF